MKSKFRLKEIIITGYYFLNHEGLFFHSGKFWHNETELKIVYNNGSKAVDFFGTKLGIIKLRKQAIKCDIKINKDYPPF